MNAAALRAMAEAGLTLEQIIGIVEASESGPEARSAAAVRQARYRARKAQSVTRDVTCDVTRDKSVSPKPPSKKAPLSPPKGGSFPPPPADQPLAEPKTPVADELWSLANQASRNRSGRAATRRAVKAALAKGATVEALAASIRDHIRLTGDHAKGLHRIIEAELWRDHLAKPLPAPDAAVLAHRRAHYAKTGEWRADWGPPPPPPPANDERGRAA